MKVYEFFQTWEEMNKQQERAMTPEEARASMLLGFPIRVWTIDDIKYSEKVLAYVAKFRLTMGERYVTLKLSSDVGRFLLEHITKRVDSIGLKMAGEDVIDCVLIYVK